MNVYHISGWWCLLLPDDSNSLPNSILDSTHIGKDGRRLNIAVYVYLEMTRVGLHTLAHTHTQTKSPRFSHLQETISCH